ncbi:MAG: hypothetical protein AB7U30_11995 [Sulfuricellaceae bacterium]|jgi:hypothetical protein
MASKLLVYHTGKTTAASVWRQGQLTGRQVFETGTEGLAAFSAFLGRHPDIPLYFLVDVIEEDFHLETAPHLWGSSRKALINRKLTQHFRADSYRHVETQGRESEGRKDDRLLLSALTGDENLKPWLDAALERKAPVAGLYSVPLLSQTLVRKLELAHLPHLLLVTRQESGALRQSYFHSGHLKFSRLTYANAQGLEPLPAMVNEESAKIGQYLNNTRLLPRDEPLHIHFLGSAAELRVLDGKCAATPRLQFTLHDLAEIGARFKYPLPPGQPASEALFLQLLARQRVANHYARRHETYFWRFNLAARAMRTSGTVMVLLGVLSAVYNVGQMLKLDQQTDTVGAQVKAVEEETRAIRATFPPLPAPPDAMKAAVEARNYLLSHYRSPEAILTLVGQTLASQPTVQLDKIQWWTTSDPETPPPGEVTAATAQPVTEEPRFQIVLLEGRVTPFTTHRNALDTVESIAKALAAIPHLKVTPIVLPLESGSQSQIRGTTDAESAASASFTLRLVYATEN